MTVQEYDKKVERLEKDIEVLTQALEARKEELKKLIESQIPF